MMLFLGGYCLAIYLIAYQHSGWLPLLTGVVFFFGALFVLFSVNIYTKTLHQLMASQASYREERDRASAALAQLEYSQLQIVQSEKMATLGSLVAGVAHEINNPVGFLNGSLENAKEYLQDLLEHIALYQRHYPNPDEAIQENEEEIDLDFLSEDFPKLLKSMKEATDRVKSLSVSFRTFSRADTEHKVSANLNEGIDSTLLILKYRLKANESRPAIKVIKDYGDVADIECFPGQLNQVFMNILANAIDALNEASEKRSFAEIKEHPHCITVCTQVEQSDLTITIADNGPGIPESVKERVFENLFTTKAVGKGTGLGLAISRQIVVDNHCGELSVTSKAGQGTTFLIRLPMNV
ncbi:MAG: ATP-binding protein [Cyanobacteria bacterium J06598_3]